MKSSSKRLLRGTALCLLALLVAAAGAGFLEAGVCWDAFIRCIEDPVNMAFLTGGLYCLNGYFFCLKYIEPQI